MNAEDGRPCYCNRVGSNHCEYGAVPDPAAMLYREIDCRDMCCRESISVSGMTTEISQNFNKWRVRYYSGEELPQPSIKTYLSWPHQQCSVSRIASGRLQLGVA